MTELQLSKFIDGVECHYNGDFTELWAMMDLGDLHKFFFISTTGLFDDEGIACVMKDGYIAVDLIPVAEYYGIEIENILPKTEENK